MDGLVIHIGWEYFLGIMFGLIVVACYTNGRFIALETSMTWVKETLGRLHMSINELTGTVTELKVTVDNNRTPVFASQSSINLNEIGEQWLIENGMKTYIDNHKSDQSAAFLD